MDAQKLAQQLELAQKTLLALEAYLAQAKSIVADTRKLLNEAQGGDTADDHRPLGNGR
jgi:hypothetical protein